ncbi:MAG TPA: hypothetical protein VFH92_08550, partial [Phenylobacterium sp.]|nr:hypothetical protein [Phenylobacterium sp.]
IATSMKQQRLIDYSRGHVTVLDRPRLVALACECYAGVEEQFDALREDPAAPLRGPGEAARTGLRDRLTARPGRARSSPPRNAPP